MPTTVLLSGASGLIGTTLKRALRADGTSIVELVRHAPSGSGQVQWNPAAPQPIADTGRLEGIAVAIHLSGANLSSHRWTPEYRRQIVESRIQTTRSLVDTLKQLSHPPHALLCASAVGIYGNRGDEILNESSPTGSGFLAETCLAWEAEANRAAEANIRVVHLRFGVVLAREGGALRQMLPIFKMGLGGRLGTGRQWMSWIAIDDLTRAVLHILQTESLRGAFNLTSPVPVRNSDFTHALGRALHRPAIFTVPRFALNAAFGQMAEEALLASTRAIPQRLAESGFQFRLPLIDNALNAILLR